MLPPYVISATPPHKNIKKIRQCCCLSFEWRFCGSSVVFADNQGLHCWQDVLGTRCAEGRGRTCKTTLCHFASVPSSRGRGAAWVSGFVRGHRWVGVDEWGIGVRGRVAPPTTPTPPRRPPVLAFKAPECKCVGGARASFDKWLGSIYICDTALIYHLESGCRDPPIFFVFFMCVCILNRKKTGNTTFLVFAPVFHDLAVGRKLCSL